MSNSDPVVIELQAEKLEDILAANDFLIINFGARWCGPCRVFKTVFTDAAGEHMDVSFAVVDVEEQLRQVHGLPAVYPSMSAWTKAMLQPFTTAFSGEKAASPQSPCRH